MSVEERDFSTFEFGDNVYHLADEVIPTMAELAGVDIGEEPTVEALGKLVGEFGTDKVLRANEPIDIPIELASALVEQSGVQQGLNRSLYTPELGGRNYGFVLITGAMANWQDRTVELVVDGIKANTLSNEVQVVTGNRKMGKLKSEQDNPNVQRFFEINGQYPTETQYATKFVVPRIWAAGGDPHHTSYETDDGDRLAANFVSEVNFSPDTDVVKPYFKDGKPVTFARVANAGIQLAVQFRSAVRENLRADFDDHLRLPEVFVRTDSFPIARTQDQIEDPANYQSPFTGLRQVALTAKLLHEAAQSE